LACETDFVARTDAFRRLAAQIAATALINASTEGQTTLEDLMSAPLMPHPTATADDLAYKDLATTVQDAILDATLQLKENIQLVQAVVYTAHDPAHACVAGYAHGGDAYTGRIAALVSFSAAHAHGNEAKVSKLCRGVAQHIVGMGPRDTTELLKQDYLLGGGTVASVLSQATKDWQVHLSVRAFERWSVDEGVEADVTPSVTHLF
jgi:translation elongation factor EF-Ts